MECRKAYAIGDLCAFSKGASIPRDRMLADGDWLYVHYGDLYKGFNLYIDIDNPSKPIPFVSSAERVKVNQFAQEGDIIYVLTSETIDDLGHAFMVRNSNGLDVLAGTETTIMRVKRKDLILPSYLNYILQTEHFKRLLRQYVTGMKVFRVHPRDISRIEISFPPISDQQTIVKVLDAFYDKLRANTKLNACLEHLCQTLFDFFDSDEDNPLVAVSEVAYVNPKRTIKKGEEALCVEMADLSTCGSFPSDWRMKTFNGGMKFVNGDTVMARITPCLENGKAGYINFLDEGQTAFGSTEYIVMATRGMLPPEYFYFLVRSSEFIAYAVRHMNGSSGRQRVSGADIEKYEIRMPNEAQISEFTKIAAPAMETILANSLENRKLAEIFDALLPKFIIGEIDASKVDFAQLNEYCF